MTIWLCGFTTAGLYWDPAERKQWPEMTSMQVVDDIEVG